MSGYHHWIDFGVMWFVAALLIFNFIYVAIRSSGIFKWNLKTPFPPDRQLWVCGIALGLFTFITRLVFPKGWTLAPLGFQLGDFPQYILMFITGIIAYRNNWLNGLEYQQGKRMAKQARIMVFLVLPLIFIITVVRKIPGDYFSGGLNAISFVYSLWEMITGILIMAAFLCIGKRKLNFPSAFWKELSANAFGVYIFHPLILISLSLSIQSLNIDPGLKFLFVAPLAVIISFVFVYILKKLSFIRAII
jgi:surface polysaccharide O-acyltransferase-like enzyme